MTVSLFNFIKKLFVAHKSAFIGITTTKNGPSDERNSRSIMGGLPNELHIYRLISSKIKIFLRLQPATGFSSHDVDLSTYIYPTVPTTTATRKVERLEGITCERINVLKSIDVYH